MKTVKTLGLALVAILALGALSASAASAYEWQVGGTSLHETTKLSTTTSKITFENTSEEYSFSCTVDRAGTVTNPGRGEITNITSTGGAKAIPCELKRAGRCRSAVEIEASGLPWSTELATVEGAVRNKILGSPEWKVKCKEIGGNTITNWCNVSPNVGPHNVAGGVEDTADVDSPHTACVADAGDPFITRGAELLELSAGTLRIAPAPVEWQLGGAGLAEPLFEEWAGNIELTDAEAAETVRCTDTAEAKSGLAGAGEVTKWTLSGCTGTVGGAKCESPVSIEALGLPWKTKLTQAEKEAAHDVTVEGKTPLGFLMTCTVLGIKKRDECTGVINTTVSNGSSGVSGTFDTGEKLACSKGGSGQGSLEGTQTITAFAGKLEVT